MDIGKILVVLSFCLIFSQGANAQDSLSIGSWASHLPYTTGHYLSQSPEKIIYSTQWSLFTIDKEDFSIEFFDKINLLSNVGINKHKYDVASEQLMIIYDDSSIDLVSGNEVFNIPDIKNNFSILGDKNIYNVRINDNKKAFLSCGFGLVEFNLEDKEFGFTCFIDFPVYQATEFGKYIIIATEDGLYAYDTELHNNPSDFQLWQHLGQINKLPEIYTAIDLIQWQDNLYMATADELWKGGTSLEFQKIYTTDNDSEISFLNTSESELMMGLSYVYEISKVLYFDEADAFVQGHHECATKIKFAEMDEQGRIWYADETGEIRYSSNKIYPCESIRINTPFSNSVSDIETKGNQVFIAAGGVDPSYTYLYRRDGFFIWDGSKWKNYNEYSQPEFKDRQIYDCFKILPHPTGEQVFVGSYQSGLLVLDTGDGSIQYFDKGNSTLAGKSGDETRERISGLALDNKNNLWISNFGAPKPVSVYTKNGEWQSLNVNSSKDLRDVVIDQNGYKWFIIDREAEGILVYDEGPDLFDPSDDRQRIISKNNSSLESNKVNAIEVDLDGDVWVGTAEGPVVFECGYSVFDATCRGSRRKTVLEGIPAYLLDEVSINCIETDGANRKWFGSENGIFVQSASGEDQIHHFTRENSPLFDNSIIDLAYNEQSGIMYIGTAKGVMSYRSQTSAGGTTHRGDIYAFPNPVRPEYEGPIAIKGFARDSNIKITNISGQLVYETKSLGGQAIWSGYDYSGRKAASGVYLVYATSTDSLDEPDAIVTKILIVK